MRKIKSAYRMLRDQGAGALWKRLLTLGQEKKEAVLDEYEQWVSCSVAGWLDEGNAQGFQYAIKNLPSDGAVIEIGSFCGLSTNLIANQLQKHGKPNPFFTCDIWRPEGSEGKRCVGTSRLTHLELHDFLRDAFIRNTRFFSRDRLPFTTEVTSDVFFEGWKAGRVMTDVFGRETILGGRAAFCYIDGHHAYEYVHRDFENCDALLVPGGFILFDDSSDAAGMVGVRQVIAEVRATGRYEVVARLPNYLFRKRLFA